jgi:regulator of nucleoside diphosphate kinase
MSSRTIMVTDADFWPLSALVRARTADFIRDREHIDKLAEELARSAPVSMAEVPADVVTMHSRVRVRDLGTGAARTYTLVFPYQADLRSGRLSVLAPLGTALLGYREGDEIEWAMPGGLHRLRIESVRQTGNPAARSPTSAARATAGRRMYQ